MRFRTPWMLTLLGAIVWASPSGAASGRSDRPVNVIFMIADGCGPASMSLGREVSGRPLTLDGILVGAATTWSTSSRVTDSAAAATALASGIKTDNRMVGVDPSGKKAVTLLERARERGLATGLVVTSNITDATPAAFASHVHSRSSQDSIAVQLVNAGVDVMLGGGRRWFLPRSRGGLRNDSLDLLVTARSRGFGVALSPSDLRAARRAPLLGLFTPNAMSYALDRDSTAEPSLPEMTSRALSLLAGRSRGFFLMVEGSRIDHAGHDNDPAAHAREVLEYDEAVRRALEFARRDGRTLVVCTADHETGGLALGLRIGGRNFYELRPESLRDTRASLERMADSILAGADPQGVVTRNTGAALEDADRDTLNAGLEAARKAPEDAVDYVIAALSRIVSRRALVGWSTGGHTAVDVGVYAFGPGSERFRGTYDNTQVARRLADLMEVRLSGSDSGPPAANGTR